MSEEGRIDLAIITEANSWLNRSENAIAEEFLRCSLEHAPKMHGHKNRNGTDSAAFKTSTFILALLEHSDQIYAVSPIHDDLCHANGC